MSHSIEIRRRATKELAHIPKPDRQRVIEAIHQLEENPHAGGLLKGEFRGQRRIRIGDWRVLYQVDDETSAVSIVTVARRRDAYRRRAR